MRGKLWRLSLFLVVMLTITNMGQCVAEASDELTVLAFDKATLADTEAEYGIALEGVTLSGENTGLYAQTGKMKISAPRLNEDGSIKNNGESNFRINWNEALDVSSYQWLNILVYSPKVTQSKVSLGAYYDGNSSICKYRDIPIDFQGWKVFSIPLDAFTGMDWSKFMRLRFSTNVYIKPPAEFSWMEEGSLNFDKIWFSQNQITLPEVKGFFPAMGSKHVSPVDACISFSFNNPLKPLSAANVSLWSKETACETQLLITGHEKDVTVQMTDALLPDTEYTLKISGVQDVYGQSAKEDISYSFRTAADTIAASKVVFLDEGQNALTTLPESGGVTAKAMVKNYAEAAAANPVLVVTLYDAAGAMKKLYQGSAENQVAALASEELTVSIPAGELAEASEIRAFVSASEAAFVMLGSRYTQLGGETVPDIPVDWTMPESYELETNQPVVEQNMLSLSGRTNVPYSRIVIKLEDAAQNVRHLIPVTADASGMFRAVCPTDFAGGIYSYTAAAENKVTEAKQLHYMSESERETVRTGVNNAQNAGEAEAILRPYLFALGFDTPSEAEITDLAAWIYGAKPYTTFDDIEARSQRYTEVKSAFAGKIWSEIPALLEQYGDLVLGTCTEYQYYSSLSTQGAKARVCEKMASALPVQTIQEFCESFREAVAAYQAEIGGAGSGSGSNPPSGGGFGGGGGGGVGLGGGYTKPTEESQPSTESAEPVEPTQPAEEKETFFDIKDVAWAKTAIEYLYENGVISDAADGKFRPFDSITREEFVKMLICAFDMELSQGGCSFRDADAAAWYYPYLCTGEKNGFILGFEDGSFGVGAFISRQDMAVIIYRVLQAYDALTQTASERVFADQTEIADYAQAAIQALCGNEIIEGNENNEFKPNAFLTRAEAAQVVYRIMELRR